MTGTGEASADGEPGRFGKTASLEVGVVLRRRPGLTRWAAHAFQPIALLPLAAPANWRVLRSEGKVVDFHAATVPLSLHRAEVEAYRVSLTMTPPSAFVVLRQDRDAPQGIFVHALTASAYEAQDYADSAEDLVEPVAMPDGLTAFVQGFVDAHFVATPFVKRKRKDARVDRKEDGIGDPRVRQLADVYRAPGRTRDTE